MHYIFGIFRSLQIKHVCGDFRPPGTIRPIVRTALLQSIRGDEFSFREHDFVMDFCVNFFSGFLGAFCPFK